jgi:hypothetical protein
MTHHFSMMMARLNGRFGQVESLHDFELVANRRPRILVQTAGHVSGAVRFYRLLLIQYVNFLKINPM